VASAQTLPGPEEATLNERLAPRRRREARVTLDTSQAKAAGLASHLDDVASDCVDRIAACLRVRWESPMAERPEIEARLFAQLDAIAEAGSRCTALLAIAEDGAEDLWVPAAAALALGSLQAGGSVDAIVAIAEGALLAEGVVNFAESVLLAPFSGAAEVAARLRASAVAPARAAAVEISFGLRPLDASTAPLRPDESAPCVSAAMLRGLSRGARSQGAQGQATLDRARACLSSDDPELAWQAARLLTLWGEPDAHEAVQSGSPPSRVLGVHALEVLVLAGGPEDLAVAQSRVRRVPASERSLDAVARLGHPGSWAYLVHHLDNDDLGDAAERALVALFGPIVAEHRRSIGAEWRDALASAESIPEGRCRGGVPWSLDVVAAECSNPALSRRELELRLDELAARTRKPMATELWRWGGGAFAALKPAIAVARR